MTTTATNRQGSRRIDLGSWLRLVCLLAVMPATKGAAPLDPLPVPDYSFGRGSSTVCLRIVDAGDVLKLDFPHPGVLLARQTLGLGSVIDDLDALSADNASVASGETFVLLFSVDALSVGVAPPDPILVALNVPYNVADQAEKCQAAGDQFMSTRLFTLSGGVGGGPFNNVLNRNNFDEGGTDFSGQPPTSADEHSAAEVLDIVNATARLARVGQAVVDVYYSVTSDSPSLTLMPSYGYPSGADIYFREHPTGYTPILLYASHEELGLVQTDDIDALVVFDTDGNDRFDGSDRVLFSLAPGSPSLATIPGASPEAAAADVFVAAPGQTSAVFASAADLGLGNPRDNIDALDFCFCEDALRCAAQHGVRSPRGDLDCDGVVGFDDIDPFVVALSGQAAYQAQYPNCNWLNADCNADGTVNFDDIDPFVALLSG